MWAVMRCASLPVHANNDTEETAEFRHEGILASNQKERQDHECPMAKTNSATLAPSRPLRRRRPRGGPPAELAAKDETLQAQYLYAADA